MASDPGKIVAQAMERMQQNALESSRLALEEAKERLRKARAEADTAELLRDAYAKAVRESSDTMKLPDLPKGVA